MSSLDTIMHHGIIVVELILDTYSVSYIPVDGGNVPVALLGERPYRLMRKDNRRIM